MRSFSSSPAATAEKGTIGSLSYLKQYLKHHVALIVAAFIALIITSSSVLGLGLALRYLVDEAIAKENIALLDNAYIILMGVIVLLAVATYARYFCITMVGEKTVAAIRNDIYAHLLTLDITFYETNRIGELLSRLTTDTTLIQTVVGSSVSIALRNTLLLTGGLIMLCVTSIELTLYVLIIVPLVVLPIIVLGKRVRRLSRATQDRVADINAHGEETLSTISTIQAFTLESYHASHFKTLVKQSLDTARQRITMRAMLTAIVITLVLGAVATILWIGGKNVILGTISVGELSSFVFYAMIVATSTGAISEVVGDLQRAAGAVERLADLKSQVATVLSPSSPALLPSQPVGSIRFDNVSFAYPSRPDKPALDSVSFTITPGSTVAFVGASGGGKSTIFKLLLRYYDPSNGKILLEDTPIQALELGALRQRLGVVQQDTVIFSDTAYHNIAVGNKAATEEDIINAAKHAEIYEFLASLPDGLQSFLGEKGVRLSGGQKQRLAIARALVRSPDILLLDEATSALDSENERKVQMALDHVMKDRTTLVIAHRLSTIQEADNIIMLDEGRIVAQGTHQELFAHNAAYQTLARNQFKEFSQSEAQS